MEESYAEGLASHSDPESCAGITKTSENPETGGSEGRKAPCEALTGAHTGGVLSRETNKIQGADDVVLIGRQHVRARKGECTSGPARSKTSSMCGSSMRENREIPCLAREDGKSGNGNGTESPWSRVPLDEKCGEGDPRNRSKLD
jgi:hypothetical protein